MARLRSFCWIGALFILLLGIPAAQAQDNLLQNGGFENGGPFGNYQTFGRADFAIARPWVGWYTNSPRTESWMNEDPIAFPHSASFKREANFSQNLGRGFATFTAGVYQVVNDIPEGTTLRASVWVYQDVKEQIGAQTRIGIGAGALSSPNAAITWSPWGRTIGGWQQISVDVTVPAGSVTIWIYSTQSQPSNPNQVYYDDASLVAVGTGEVPDVPPGGGDVAVPAPTSSPAPIFAPFVNPQSADNSGRIVHTVQSGDTLAAIAVAYGVTIEEIRQKNNLTGGFLQIGQQIIISEGTPAVPTSQSGSSSPASATFTSTPAVAQASSSTPTTSVVVEPTPGSVIAAPTTAPTEEPQPPTMTPTPEFTPTMTNTPAPAPVTPGAEADPASAEAAVCVLLFEDVDQNRIQSASEPVLAGGLISLRQNDTVLDSIETTGAEPTCFEDLEPGSYQLAAVAPEGLGLTTPGSLVVNIQPGNRFQINFGAARGVAVAAVPTTDALRPTPAAPVDAADDENPISAYLGLIVLGLAGLVVVGGAGAAFIARRL